MEQINLGTLALQSAEVTFTERHAKGGRLGNLGNGFLRYFILTLDYPGKSLRVERRIDE